jgi:ribosomal-protein-alanine N-acetyltransferase
MSECGIAVREATDADLPEVIRINIESLPEHYTFTFWRNILYTWGKAFLVAELCGEIVGYIMCRTLWRRSFFGNFFMGRVGHIISIAVKEGYRGRGVGTKLLVEAMRRLHTYYGAREVYLEVRVSNERAIRLYKKLGFRVVQRVAGYYADGEDAYIMARPLPYEGSNEL